MARKYADRVRTNSLRQNLGRVGKDLSAAEDIDIAYTACEMGLGDGLFTSLRLKHLILPERLTLDYFMRISEAMAFSEVILQYLWSGHVPNHNMSRTERLFQFYREVRQGANVRQIERARRRGLRRATDFIRSSTIT